MSESVPAEPLPGTPSLDATDAGSEAVRKPGAFRVTAADLKARVASVEYVERGVLNVAIVKLDNGYWLVGKSAPVDPTNYSAEYGRTLAYEDALRQAWPLLAFGHLETHCTCQGGGTTHVRGDAFCAIDA